MIFIGGKRKFDLIIQGSVQSALELLHKKQDGYVPSGFHPAEKIRGLITQWIDVPWGPGVCTVKVRTLGAGEYPDVSLLDVYKDYQDEQSYATRRRMLNLQIEYCSKALVNPAYDELEGYVLEAVPEIKAGREAYEVLNKRWEIEKNEDKRAELAEQLKPMTLAYSCLFPANFMASIAAWCECVDLVDIKKITEDKLIEAFSLSVINHNRPSDNIPGVFLERSRNEIDAQAYNFWHKKFDKPEKKPGKK